MSKVRLPIVRRLLSTTARRPAPARPALEELEARLALSSLPFPDHVVIAIEENHSYGQIIGSADAPYINALAGQGALFTQSYAIEHPSEPNYLDLYSGSDQGVHDDSCPHTFFTPNLGGELEASGYSFNAFSEDLPAPGSTACTSQQYARKHAPWVNFTDTDPNDHVPFAGYFPDDYSTLPTVAFVIPNQNNDMHNGSGAAPIRNGDAWLQNNLDAYVQWTYDNNSLFILTFDEDNGAAGNRIATIFVGPMVVPGQYDETINHFTVLRTLEDVYGLPYAGASADVDPVADVWASGAPAPRGRGGDAGAVRDAARLGSPVAGHGWTFQDPLNTGTIRDERVGNRSLLPPQNGPGNGSPRPAEMAVAAVRHESPTGVELAAEDVGGLFRLNL